MARSSATDTLAATARARRKQLGLRQSEVADLAGTAERFVYSLEAGKETVRLDKVLAVLQVLGLGLTVRPGHGDIAFAAPREHESSGGGEG